MNTLITVICAALVVGAIALFISKATGGNKKNDE